MFHFFLSCFKKIDLISFFFHTSRRLSTHVIYISVGFLKEKEKEIRNNEQTKSEKDGRNELLYPLEIESINWQRSFFEN